MSARPLLPSLLILVLVGLAPPARAQEGHTLAYKSTDGEEVGWRLTSKGAGKVEMKQGETSQTQDLAVDMRVEYQTTGVAKDAAWSFDFALTLLAIKQTQDGVTGADMELTGTGAKMNGQPQPPSPQLDAAIAAFDKPAVRFSSPPSGADLSTEQLLELPLDVAPMVGLLLPVLPADGAPKAVGEKWKGKRAIYSDLKLDPPPVIELEYVLEKVEGGIAEIAVSGKLELADRTATNRAGVSVKIDRATYEVTGGFEFDVAAGSLAGTKLTLDTTLEMAPPGAGSVKLQMPADYVLDRKKD